MSDTSRSLSGHDSFNLVQEHYNQKTTNADDLNTRAKSPIFYMRNFNNWIKSVLIAEYTRKLRKQDQQKISVLDLGAGRGGDILKWKKANVSRVTFLDLAEVSLDECRNRYNNPQRANFEAQFIHLDATRDLIATKLSQSELKHDLVSSQFVIHYSFESFKQADTFLQNVSDCLRVGGYFIGTTTDSNELVARLKKSETNSFGNELYNIKFATEDKASFPLFGVKFDFQLDNVVECPEFLINFKALVKLAKRHNLELVFNENFSQFFSKYSQVPEYKKLITIMKAMEPYYSNSMNKGDTIDADLRDREYEIVEGILKEEKYEIEQGMSYVTLSRSEWEAITLYQCFAFVKVGEAEATSSPGLKRKRKDDEEVDGKESSDNEELGVKKK